MKLWIADSLSSSVAMIFQAPDQATPLENLLATMIFAFQLYVDFAGYSLIAIGAARLLGIRLGDNFRQPFLSPTLADFWRAWHISLFTWLRDYVFAPLRTMWRRSPVAGPAAAIQITLILVGIWHGTGWGFLAYGTLHGTLLALSFSTLSWRNARWTKLGVPFPVVNAVRIPITFMIVALSLVLIRAKDLSQALHIYSLIFSKEFIYGLFNWDRAFHVFSSDWLPTNLALIAVVIVGDVMAHRGVDFDRAPRMAMSCVYSVCVLAILYQAISANASKPFVYFNF
jgi:D-alanyl-lipoteichoic acid acyltransferase DltB (MBOAT superfamily)